MKRKHVGSGKAAELLKKHASKMLLCSVCQEREEKVDSDCESVVCCMCVQKKVPIDPKFLERQQPKDPSEVKPRGWKFMAEFVDKDGTVYHRGTEQPDLKGTLPPTDVEKIRKQQKETGKVKKEKKRLRALKKEERLAKEYKKKKAIKEKDKEKKQQKLDEMKG